MTTLAGWLTILNLIFLVGGSIAGYFSVRSAIAKANADTQIRVREALHDENELLRGRVQRLEAENKQQGKILQLIITTLKKVYHIDLDIENDVITMRSANGNVSRVSADTP